MAAADSRVSLKDVLTTEMSLGKGSLFMKQHEGDGSDGRSQRRCHAGASIPHICVSLKSFAFGYEVILLTASKVSEARSKAGPDFPGLSSCSL